jgi:hypothetical protein
MSILRLLGNPGKEAQNCIYHQPYSQFLAGIMRDMEQVTDSTFDDLLEQSD